MYSSKKYFNKELYHFNIIIKDDFLISFDLLYFLCCNKKTQDNIPIPSRKF